MQVELQEEYEMRRFVWLMGVVAVCVLWMWGGPVWRELSSTQP